MTSFNEKRAALLREQLEKLRLVTADGVTALATMRLPGILASSDGEAVPKVGIVIKEIRSVFTQCKQTACIITPHIRAHSYVSIEAVDAS